MTAARPGICRRCGRAIGWLELVDGRPFRGRNLVVAVVPLPIRMSDRERTAAEERADPHGDAAVLSLAEGDTEPRWRWSDADGLVVGYEIHARRCAARP